jgi:pyruvate dehydrogenase (quinone)
VPGKLKPAISSVFAADGLAIVDVIAVPDELPNLPHLDLDLIGHIAIAKVKEAVLAATGA